MPNPIEFVKNNPIKSVALLAVFGLILLALNSGGGGNSASTDNAGYGQLYRQPTDAELLSNTEQNLALLASNNQANKDALNAALANKSLDYTYNAELATLKAQTHAFDLTYTATRDANNKAFILEREKVQKAFVLGQGQQVVDLNKNNQDYELGRTVALSRNNTSFYTSYFANLFNKPKNQTSIGVSIPGIGGGSITV